jgi:hypothetical protein
MQKRIKDAKNKWKTTSDENIDTGLVKWLKTKEGKRI